MKKQTVWRWDARTFCQLVYSKLREEAAEAFISRVSQADHLVKFPDFFHDGSVLGLSDTYDWGDGFFFFYEKGCCFYLFHEEAEVLGRDFVNRKMEW